MLRIVTALSIGILSASAEGDANKKGKPEGDANKKGKPEGDAKKKGKLCKEL